MKSGDGLALHYCSQRNQYQVSAACKKRMTAFSDDANFPACLLGTAAEMPPATFPCCAAVDGLEPILRPALCATSWRNAENEHVGTLTITLLELYVDPFVFFGASMQK